MKRRVLMGKALSHEPNIHSSADHYAVVVAERRLLLHQRSAADLADRDPVVAGWIFITGYQLKN